MEREKYVDESWKENAQSEKKAQDKKQDEPKITVASDSPPSSAGTEDSSSEEIEVTFLNYLTSLAFQCMIFLGEIPNPMNDNKIDRNLKQARFLIDTLILLREKTKGNLAKEEEDFLNASLYELEMRYVEHSQKEKGK